MRRLSLLFALARPDPFVAARGFAGVRLPPATPRHGGGPAGRLRDLHGCYRASSRRHIRKATTARRTGPRIVQSGALRASIRKSCPPSLSLWEFLLILCVLAYGVSRAGKSLLANYVAESDHANVRSGLRSRYVPSRDCRTCFTADSSISIEYLSTVPETVAPSVIPHVLHISCFTSHGLRYLYYTRMDTNRQLALPQAFSRFFLTWFCEIYLALC